MDTFIGVFWELTGRKWQVSLKSETLNSLWKGIPACHLAQQTEEKWERHRHFWEVRTDHPVPPSRDHMTLLAPWIWLTSFTHLWEYENKRWWAIRRSWTCRRDLRSLLAFGIHGGQLARTAVHSAELQERGIFGATAERFPKETGGSWRRQIVHWKRRNTDSQSVSQFLRYAGPVATQYTHATYRCWWDLGVSLRNRMVEGRD